MTLGKRLARLEATREGANPEPFVILFSVAEAVSDIRVNGGSDIALRTASPRFAILSAGPFGSGETVSCADGEAEQTFRDRVKEAILRLHGRLPGDWQ